jgi:hypothetical protein
VALTHREGVDTVWSIVSTVRIENVDLLQPYDKILKRTGARLRILSLSSAQEYPLILRHLMDQCPGLHSLSLSCIMVVQFSTIRPLLATLLGRLCHLRIHDPDHHLDPSWAEHTFLGLKQLFEHVEASLTKLEHLELFEGHSQFCPDPVFLEFVLSKLPNLVRLDASISMENSTLFSACPNLKHFRLREVEATSDG